ncbi:MAG: hypothetical protein AUJ18_05525 [Candidatus Hydrogenedentes bacterium CG1_02_42_14]|nr:MAG: hypothetical protein AUJ18_05525 [Candidatus Hydrogenedentes bacterium CG1_02_42_14]
MIDSIHFQDMLNERQIKREWVDSAISNPDRIEDRDDGTRHYIKQIPEYGNRWLRVVTNVISMPEKSITAFFDRRIRRTR